MSPLNRMHNKPRPMRIGGSLTLISCCGTGDHSVNGTRWIQVKAGTGKGSGMAH